MKTYQTLREYVENEVSVNFVTALKVEPLCYPDRGDQVLDLVEWDHSDDTLSVCAFYEHDDVVIEDMHQLVTRDIDPSRFRSDCPLYAYDEMPLLWWRHAVMNAADFSVDVDVD